ncbi:TIGR03773 family transporter-associated surface protein [Micromonospora musae]|uniref:TIGR03773 family transporter-associated surface protein n=1 Tax=Micromonospora musae TaxID=1894970 RepID=UPI003432CD8D
MKRHHLLLFPFAVVLAIASGAVAALPAAAPAGAAVDAVTSKDRPTSSIAGGDVLDLAVAGPGLVLGTRSAGSTEVKDPADVLLTVPAAAQFSSSIDATAIPGGLPEGSSAGRLTVTLESVTVPDGGGVQVRDGFGVVVLGSGALDARSLTVAAGQSRDDNWLFNADGRYILTFTASLTVTDDHGAASTLTAPPTVYNIQVGGPTRTSTTLAADPPVVSSGGDVALAATVTPADAEGSVEFSDGATPLGTVAVADGKAAYTARGLADGKHLMTARFIPSWSTDFAETTSPAVTVRVGEAAVGVTVLDSGSLTLTPKLTMDGGTAACAATMTCQPTGLVAGLLDKTAVDGVPIAAGSEYPYSQQPWYAADDVVIHVPARGDGYTLPTMDNSSLIVNQPVKGTDQTAAQYLSNEPPNNLLLGANLGMGPTQTELLNAPYYKSMFGYTYVLQGLGSAPEEGVVSVTTSKTAAGVNAVWDSAKPRAEQQDWDSRTFGAVRSAPFEWSFTQPGVYCTTIAESVTLKPTDDSPSTTVNTAGTYTIVVGDTVDPRTVTPCAQQPYDGGGASGDPDQIQIITDEAHRDIRLYRSGGQLTFGMGDPARTPLRSQIWANTPAPKTVEKPTSTVDATAVGPVGTEYWYFPNSSNEDSPWPGISTESLNRGDFRSPITYRFDGFSLDGVANPAGVNVALLTEMQSDRAFSLFNTRLGSPTAFQEPVNTHFHPYWTFTAPGVYCVAVDATAQLTDGSWASGSGQITFVVGDAVDPATVTPCERNGKPVPVATPHGAVSVDTTGVYRATGDDDENIELTLEQSKLAAVASTTASVNTPARYRDPEDVILEVPTYSQQTESWRLPGVEQLGLGLDTTRLDPARLKDGVVTIGLGTVDGPGAVATTNSADTGVSTSLSSAAGGNRSFDLVARSVANRGGPFYWSFSKAGVYCVPITAHATLADGTQTQTSMTLTFVAGNTTDSHAADYVDSSQVTTCSRGQHGQPAQQPSSGGGGDDGTVGHDDIYVPNESVTNSGAVIVNNGHVDLASKLAGGTLETWVKDTTESSDARYHPLVGSHSMDSSDRGDTNNGNGAVFQVLPDAKTTVPAGDTYAFLGAPGSAIWQVSQVQQPDLLWPGWSTEEIPVEATQTGVQWALDRVSGPGEFALYESGLDSADVFFNTRDGVTSADSYLIPKNAHVHGSWAFSAEGTYCLGFTRSTTLASGQHVSDDFTLAVAVGQVAVRKVDPGKCFTAPGRPDTQDVTPVPESQLTDATAGGVQVLGDEDGFSPGQLVTVQVGAARAGQWVSMWLHSAPTWLGWTQVGSSGAVQVRLPADAALGSHKVVAKTDGGDLIGWDVLSLAASPDDGGGDPGGPDAPGPDPDPGPGPGPGGGGGGPNSCATTTTVISSGHLDYSTQVIGGRVRSLIGDNSSGTEVFRDPSETVLWLKPSSKVRLPSGYEQVGAPGSTVYMVPQTQNSDLIWLGWSTETLNSSKVSSPVTWKLTEVDGPGDVTVFLNGAFGGVQSMVFHGPGTYTESLGVHAHANWAFSAQGIYRLHVTQSATLAGGGVSSDSEVLTIAVGDVDPVTAVPGGENCVGQTPPAAGGAGPGSLAPVAAGTSGGSKPAQCTPARTTVISTGHLDWNSQIVGGKLESLIGDDSAGTRVYRQPSTTVLWLKPASKVTLPSGFDRIGAAGSTVWQVPQTQRKDLIWLGWSTELLNSGNAAGPVTWSLTGVDGPGTVKVYTTGSFGGVQESVFNGPGTYRINLGVHAHANWAFSAQGVYRLHFTQTVTLKNGKTSTDSEVLTVAVGDVDPTTVTTAASGCGVLSHAVLTGDQTLVEARAADQQAQARAAQAAAGQLPGVGTAVASTLWDGPVPLLLGILGGLLLVGAAGTGLLWWRRRRWKGVTDQAPVGP